MGDPGRYRDATQIVLPADALADVRADLEAEFTVSVVVSDEGLARIVGSPVVIKDVGEFLARHGVTLP